MRFCNETQTAKEGRRAVKAEFERLSGVPPRPSLSAPKGVDKPANKPALKLAGKSTLHKEGTAFTVCAAGIPEEFRAYGRFNNFRKWRNLKRTESMLNLLDNVFPSAVPLLKN